MHSKQADFWRLAVSEHHDKSGIVQQIMKSLPETSLRIVQSRGVNLAQNTMSHRDYLFLHRQYSISGKEPSSAMTLVDLFFGPLVFQFFGPDNLVRVSTVSLTWWRYVFQGCKSTVVAWMWRYCFSRDGEFIPESTSLILCTEKNDQLQGDVNISKRFSKAGCCSKGTSHIEPRKLHANYRTINLSSETLALFFEKDKHISQQTVERSFCCLSVPLPIITICARGLKLDENELLSLEKTFPQLANGQLD